MENYSEGQTINVGTGEDLTIKSLAELVRDVVNPDAKIVFDTDKPDGTPRKMLDVSRLHSLGWKHGIDLKDGIESTYKWFCDNAAEAVT